jgi:mitogen-activated protein kinase kinase
MSSPAVRKKRNFKSLAVQVDTRSKSYESPTVASSKVSGVGVPVAVVAATRVAPIAPGKRKPPAMDLSKSRAPLDNLTMSQRSPIPLPVSTPKSAELSSSSPSQSSFHSLQERLATMEIGHPDAAMDLRVEDFLTLSELGQGNGGSVSKVEHIPTQQIMAKKVRNQTTA